MEIPILLVLEGGLAALITILSRDCTTGGADGITLSAEEHGLCSHSIACNNVGIV